MDRIVYRSGFGDPSAHRASLQRGMKSRHVTMGSPLLGRRGKRSSGELYGGGVRVMEYRL